MGKGFIAIAAMSENRVIGANGKIPWHIPDEFKWFKQATMGHTLVMGRKTYESIGRPLPGRKTIVLSRQPLAIPGVTVVDSLDKIDPAASAGEIFIAGGAEIYRQALPLVSEIYLTVVKKEVEGDVLFPVFEEQFKQVEVLREHPEFTVYRYQKIEPTRGSSTNSFRYFPADMAALLGVNLFPMVLLISLLACALINSFNVVLLCLLLIPSIIGMVLLFMARLPLYRERRFLSIGPKGLDKKHRRLYWAGYVFVGIGIVLLISAIIG